MTTSGVGWRAETAGSEVIAYSAEVSELARSVNASLRRARRPSQRQELTYRRIGVLLAG
jgi:hypothetical protein